MKEHNLSGVVSYPLEVIQFGQKLKLNTQTFIGVQLQDGQLGTLKEQDAGCGGEEEETSHLAPGCATSPSVVLTHF